jgi:hypothetical protein
MLVMGPQDGEQDVSKHEISDRHGRKSDEPSSSDWKQFHSNRSRASVLFHDVMRQLPRRLKETPWGVYANSVIEWRRRSALGECRSLFFPQ